MESTPADAGRTLKPPKTIGQKCLASFLVRCQTTRGGRYFSDAELHAVLAWTHETLDCCEALSAIPRARPERRGQGNPRSPVHTQCDSGWQLDRRLGGARLIVVSPTPEESAALAAWGLTSTR